MLAYRLHPEAYADARIASEAAARKARADMSTMATDAADVFEKLRPWGSGSSGRERLVGCAQLFSRISADPWQKQIPHRVCDIEFLDQVVDVIATEPVPSDAKTPKMSALARLEFIEEQIRMFANVETVGGLPPFVHPAYALDVGVVRKLIKVESVGVEGVFAACRALKRAHRAVGRARAERQAAGRRMLNQLRRETLVQASYSSDMEPAGAILVDLPRRL